MKGEESPGFILRLPNSKRTPLCQRKSQKTGAGALMEGSDSLPLTWKMVRRKSKATARQLTLLPLLLLDLLISSCGLGPRRNPGTSSGEATALESVRQDWQYQSISEQSCPGTAGALGQGALTGLPDFCSSSFSQLSSGLSPWNRAGMQRSREETGLAPQRISTFWKPSWRLWAPGPWSRILYFVLLAIP